MGALQASHRIRRRTISNEPGLCRNLVEPACSRSPIAEELSLSPLAQNEPPQILNHRPTSSSLQVPQRLDGTGGRVKDRREAEVMMFVEG